jgi:hypothetical protein
MRCRAVQPQSIHPRARSAAHTTTRVMVRRALQPMAAAGQQPVPHPLYTHACYNRAQRRTMAHSCARGHTHTHTRTRTHLGGDMHALATLAYMRAQPAVHANSALRHLACHAQPPGAPASCWQVAHLPRALAACVAPRAPTPWPAAREGLRLSRGSRVEPREQAMVRLLHTRTTHMGTRGHQAHACPQPTDGHAWRRPLPAPERRVVQCARPRTQRYAAGAQPQNNSAARQPGRAHDAPACAWRQRA